MADRDCRNNDPAWINIMYDAAQRGLWPSVDRQPNITDKELDAKAAAIWKRTFPPIIDQIARVRTEG